MLSAHLRFASVGTYRGPGGGRIKAGCAAGAARRYAWVALLAAYAIAVLPGAALGATARSPVVNEVGGRLRARALKRKLGADRAHEVRGSARTARFVSAPALDPPTISVPIDRDARAGAAAGGGGDRSELGPEHEYIFLAPHIDFADHEPFIGAAGPEIIEPDGKLVWQLPMRGSRMIGGQQAQRSANDFTTATYKGNPVLVWWEGYMNAEATIGGVWVIANEHYRRIATIRPPRGLGLDLHDIQITPNGMAYVIASRRVALNLKGCCGGPVDGSVYDQEILEIDIATGKVVWSWDALAHIPLRDSYERIPTNRPWFPYHINSIAFGPSGNLIVSARNTWAAYWIKRVGRKDNGAILATLGGKSSTFKLGPGARFAWQHDVQSNGSAEVLLFDDEAAPVEGKQSRGLILSLDWKRHTASVARQYLLPRPQLAGSQGNVELEPDGDVFVGWGQLPYFTEYTASGKLLYEGVLPGPDGSYRAYRAPWVGLPPTRPALVALRAYVGDAVDLYVSWNGATQVAYWRLLSGPSVGNLTVSGAPLRRQGFQTTIVTTAKGPYFALQALAANGTALGTSMPTRVRESSLRRPPGRVLASPTIRRSARSRRTLSYVRLPRRSSTGHGMSRSRISGFPVRSVSLRAQAVAIAKQSPSAIGLAALMRAAAIISVVPGRSSSNVLRNPASTYSASERPWSRSTR
jgi:hypothetical protein